MLGPVRDVMIKHDFYRPAASKEGRIQIFLYYKARCDEFYTWKSIHRNIESIKEIKDKLRRQGSFGEDRIQVDHLQ